MRSTIAADHCAKKDKVAISSSLISKSLMESKDLLLVKMVQLLEAPSGIKEELEYALYLVSPSVHHP